MPVIPAPTRASHELPHAHFTSLATPRLGSRETSLWRVQLMPGAEPVLHSVTREEIFVVLRGTARVQIAGALQEVGEGASIIVPADVSFGLSSADDQPAELLCCLPVGGQARLGDGQLFTPPWAE